MDRIPAAARQGRRILLLDNYDSFTWNLAQYLEELGAQVEVRRNDRVDPLWIGRKGFEGIVISPGPGRPERAGISLELVRAHDAETPLLGVCLGHQAIGMAWGARIVSAPRPMHGKTSWIHHDGHGLFRGLPTPFEATRYHSLVIDPDSIREPLVVTARSAGGVVMGVRHRTRPLYGVQFHPESVLTREGKRLLGNFLDQVARRVLEPERPSSAASRPAALARTPDW